MKASSVIMVPTGMYHKTKKVMFRKIFFLSALSPRHHSCSISQAHLQLWQYILNKNMSCLVLYYSLALLVLSATVVAQNQCRDDVVIQSASCDPTDLESCQERCGGEGAEYLLNKCCAHVGVSASLLAFEESELWVDLLNVRFSTWTLFASILFVALFNRLKSFVVDRMFHNRTTIFVPEPMFVSIMSMVVRMWWPKL